MTSPADWNRSGGPSTRLRSCFFWFNARRRFSGSDEPQRVMIRVSCLFVMDAALLSIIDRVDQRRWPRLCCSPSGLDASPPSLNLQVLTPVTSCHSKRRNIWRDVMTVTCVYLRASGEKVKVSEGFFFVLFPLWFQTMLLWHCRWNELCACVKLTWVYIGLPLVPFKRKAHFSL